MQETWVQSLAQEDPLEKEMATHCSILAWEIQGQRSLAGCSLWCCKELDTTERLHFASFSSSFWRRKWQPTPVFLSGESHGRRGLVGYSLWDRKEYDTTKQLTQTHTHTHTHTHTKCKRLGRHKARRCNKIVTPDTDLDKKIGLGIRIKGQKWQ